MPIHSSLATVKCHDLLRIAYKWLAGQNYTAIMRQTGHDSKTITTYLRFCRELVAAHVSQGEVIGGPGIVVEVDESKFGRRKYHRGHRVEGVWVLGGVERTEKRRVFLVPVPDRKTETLVAVLRHHVAPGSIVHTDLWRGYSGLADALGVHHLTVNHSQGFRDHETGVDTNTIEGTWAGIKIGIAPRHRCKAFIAEHLAEFIWRRQNEGNLWDGFIRGLRETKY